ncbi:MAG: glycosyltransferase [Fibrobacterales bacterium]
MIIPLLILLPTLIYAIILITLIAGVIKLRDRRNIHSRCPSVSIVVPLYNEEEGALQTLSALAAQEYIGEWEVICIDDRSTDLTYEIISTFCDNHSRFSCYSIPHDVKRVDSPKKRALETGFSYAQNEVFMSIDADSIPPVGWLKSMSQNFHSAIEIVQGPKQIRGNNTPVIVYQKIETLVLTLLEGTLFTLKFPVIASAPSLGYLRTLYNAVGGFEDHKQYISGDDDMLVQAMSKKAQDFCYNLDPAAAVQTSGVQSVSELFSQRARWCSNATHYENRWYVLLIFTVYAYFLFLGITPILYFVTDITPVYLLGPWVIKLTLDLIFLSIGSKKLNSRLLVVGAPFALIFSVPLLLWAIPAGYFKLFKWGGQ